MAPSFRLTPPEPLELVPADEVHAMIASTDRELAMLEREAAAACGAADEAEARAREAGVDGRASAWAMVRMQRFLDGLRGEADREVNEVLDVARARARARIDDAHAEAAVIRGDTNSGTPPREGSRGTPDPRHEPERGSPGADLDEQAAAPVPSIGSAAVATLASVETDALVEPASEVEPIPGPEPTPWVPIAPVVVAAPATEPAVVDHAPSAGEDADNHEASAAETDDPDTTMPATAVDAIAPADADAITWNAIAPAIATETVTEITPAASDPLTEKPQVDFWQEPPPKSKKGWRRIPVSAVLEVLAVLLILVFILLRLS
jgi:hypothetical protein